jgi:ATP-dependent DNA ligase
MTVFLYAFDLIELNGDVLRREPLVVRKATLASVLARAAVGVRLKSTRSIRPAHLCYAQSSAGQRSVYGRASRADAPA